MKFVRFTINNQLLQGIIENEKIKEISGDIFSEWEETGNYYDQSNVKLVSPIVPNQIIGIGANFVSDKLELPEELPEVPVFFFKPVSSVIGPSEEIIIPKGIDQVKFESELAVVIGKETKDVAEEDVFDHIFGYTIGNDVTAPQFFHQDGHWTVGKAFDTFTPLGPVIETELELEETRIRAKLNGQLKQDSSPDLMIISIQKMIAFLSKVMTLRAGDVILTGSPVGAELIGEGDIISCEIESIGQLANTVVRSKAEVKS
ncbi:fumarylacetoacetate hydrolase family protein [Cytobacillus sp. Sa5YUA1]|uniref:Fumarylacetoacetate hydrolase family protein n=1 Tax=Cytobacillus stercorigallinarum TaxID=2762240 RepID=A0ABR8QRG0_9BACI|nr:fumarylacetoacetate hydrolase family protein [Cytobacillus stercorigallinarum]MBD7937882.1 fumarylacetoacetate hydrolase family protein [Cytobacillus stercorigallinarum]